MYGEGNYALTDIKEIQVTEEFLGLGTAITDCQNKEYRSDWSSRQYQEKVASSCSCAPLNLKQFHSHQVTGDIDNVRKQNLPN